MVGFLKFKGFYFFIVGDFFNEKIFFILNLVWIYIDR